MNEPRTRVAVVTGASSGIGAEVSRRLVSEGWNVGMVGRSTKKLAAVAEFLPGASVLTLQADVKDPSELAAAVVAVEQQWGRLDLVVANAGLLETGKVADLSPAVWQDLLDTNLTGTFYTVQATLPLVRASGGRYVVISSVAATRGLPGLSGYSAAKAGVKALSESLASEYESEGVRSTTILLGPTDTPMLDRPGVSQYKLQASDLAEVVNWLADLPSHVVVREIPLRAIVR